MSGSPPSHDQSNGHISRVSLVAEPRKPWDALDGSAPSAPGRLEYRAEHEDKPATLGQQPLRRPRTGPSDSKNLLRQVEVNNELKRLLLASVDDPHLPFHFERLAWEKQDLAQRIAALEVCVSVQCLQCTCASTVCRVHVRPVSVLCVYVQCLLCGTLATVCRACVCVCV